MNITVNGEARTCTEGLSLLTFVQELDLSPEKMVVERNLSIVPSALFAETLLQDGDALEILQFVGGG